MKDNFKSLPVALRMIFKDPINLMLTLIPTIIALVFYLIIITAAFKNSDIIVVYLRDYIHSPETRGYVGKFLTALLIVFIFFIMSWTFMMLVAIIAAPFNSMLSSRIEKKLIGRPVEKDQKRTFKEVMSNLGFTFINEAKKLGFIFILTVLAFFLNFFPLLYPIGLGLIALLLSVQFIDYSWSRHEMSFGACLKDVTKNIFPYLLGGFCFLLLITVPIINAIVPAFATSYFTVLWLHRQNKIPPPSLPQK